MNTAPALLTAAFDLPTLPVRSRADIRDTILLFFTAELRNEHTQRAYKAAAGDFFRFADRMPGGDRFETLTAMHVVAWIDAMKTAGLSVPTIKARLAAVRRLLQYVAQAGLLRHNPAAVVRGEKFSVKRGKTPVLSPDEARQLLDAIDTTTLIGLRDRALIGTMIYSFARIGAVLGLRVEDLFHQQRRLWLRLHEKGGKLHDVPCHHNLEVYLGEYVDAAALDAQPGAALFQTLDRSRSALSGRGVTQPLAWEMVQRRIKAAGIDTAACNHTFRATGITAYLKNGGTLERAAAMANHASTRTTQLYDRRPDDITLDEIEKISI